MDIKRTVHGVGYVGVGRHIISVKGMRTHTYMTWYNMMTRCYSNKVKKNRPTYKNCKVCDEWHDFQNFATWYESNPNHGNAYQLDKDLLSKGDGFYSPETCCLLPREINSALTFQSPSNNRLCGTSWNKNLGKWKSEISKEGKREYLGYFDNEADAHFAYIKAKELYVRYLACKWIKYIDDHVFNALNTWSMPNK